MHLLALADDTTGALEIGAQFAGAGLRSLVTLAPSLDPASEALVIDTHTRHRPAAEAHGCILRLAQSARYVPYLYKKTDSTLRGNIPAEFDALRAVFPDRALVYVPAYPRLGRTVTNGILHVDGLPRASILELLGGAATLATPATLAEAIRPGALLVCDGACEADLEAAAAAPRAAVCPSIPAGPAAFAAHWP